MKKRFRIIWLIVPAAILVCIFAFWLTLCLIPYPELTKLQQQNYSTKFCDRNGTIIQINSLDEGLRREFTPLKEIPKPIVKAFIAAEDQRFYFHNGVDYFAAIKAFFQNKAAGKTVRGASTITMQLVKIISQDKSYGIKRKISDVFNAYRIEAKLSKKQILELYLNSVPFGHNSEGITSGARTIFNGTELNQLTPEQICCLAVIPRRPSLYSPLKNPDVCGERAGELAARIYPKVDKNSVKMAAAEAHLYEYPFYMPHFVNYVRTCIEKDYKGDRDKIVLSADLQVQRYAEDQLRTALSMSNDNRISNASLIILDNKDNSVLAWVGNHFWYDMEHSGQVDGVLAKNQPGSSMKPFLYALALEQKDEQGNNLYYPSKILADIPTEFGKQEVYVPGNFNNRFNGPIRFRIALASSLNIPAVAILEDLGVDNYLKKLYELGFESLKYNGKKADLGLALGAGEVSLKELVNGFSVFAKDGFYDEINIFREDGDRPLINQTNLTQRRQVYSKDTVRIIDSILSDKGARALGFGANQTFQTDYPSIFKTGTSNQYQNIVALGATKKFTVGVWMGNFSGQTVIGKTGSSFPALVAKNILDYLEKDHKITEENSFPEPENWHKQTICSLSGLSAGAACPATVMEYVKEGTDLKTCDWHTKDSGETKLILPAEYQQWARLSNSSAQIDYSSSQLKILTPKDNSIFYYSQANKDRQLLPVEIVGGEGTDLKVLYDGNLYDVISRPFKFSLPLEKGNHTCVVNDGFEQQEFNFTVK